MIIHMFLSVNRQDNCKADICLHKQLENRGEKLIWSYRPAFFANYL